MGYLPGDKEAPKEVVMEYEPCEACKENWKNGVALVEVTSTPNTKEQPPMQKDAYPTGRYFVVSKDALNTEIPGGIALVIKEEFEVMFADMLQPPTEV